MCIILLLYKLNRDYPILIAGNRDERPERAAHAPESIPGLAGRGRLVGPRDARSGGVYLAANTHALALGITNKVTDPSGVGFKSRGQLALACARQSSCEAVEATIRNELRHYCYNHFNLLYADRDRAAVTYYRRGEGAFYSLVTEELQPGAHALTQGPVDQRDDPRITAALRQLDGVESLSIKQQLDRLKRVCSASLERVDTPDGEVRTLDTCIMALHGLMPTQSRCWYLDRFTAGGDYTDFSNLFACDE